mgnify:CR=1 FL=1
MSTQKVAFLSGERPSTTVNVGISILLALATTAIIFLILWQLKGTFIRDLFIGRYENDPGRYIFQGLITFMWALSTVTVIQKRVILRKEFRMLQELPIPDDLDMTDIPGLIEVYENLCTMPDVDKRMAGTRVARVLAMWINTEDFERCSQTAKEESELDQFTADASFRGNRLFIWTMPLLGFLGTVYGVSYGIGGFAEFLRGEVTAEEIKYQVGLITQGLAIAFYTTLLGLFTSGGAAYPSMQAERAEEEILGAIDEFIGERLIARMPSAKKTEFPSEHIKAIRDGMAELTQYMVAPMQELARQIEDGFRRLPSPQRYEDVFAQAIAKAGDLIADRMRDFNLNYEVRVGELGEQLAGKLHTVSQDFREGTVNLAKELNGQADRIAQATRQQLDLQASSQQTWSLALTKASEQEAARWKEISTDLQRQVGDVGQQLNQTIHVLREATGLAARGADEAARGLANQMTRLVDVGANIEKTLQATKAVEVVLQDLASADDFRQTLLELRAHLKTSDELIKKLAKPKQIVLQESR